ncbi:Piso0_001855 [Millerozyma farinosa CBS 7064]|uniref:Piso0_001855 protein n=1 Tax=Pichia sorbitophila (strain ATCC MYA-4447 / BCRC 22081 / CBS 7064 / NBRC 10061 / NRRL Y-12695) TaxID=559304 RepID=G8YLX3_PICSO|nr:Piso0_001855 [Millerozyma farinosa CBS 7064]
MITPYFSINQDDEFIYIDIKVSHVRFSGSAVEMIVQEELFIFSLPPYYLRLRLPKPCIDDERSHSYYDSKNESVNVKIPKLNKGEWFPDLDLQAKLLARQVNNEQIREVDSVKKDEPSQKSGPLIEELDVSNNIVDTQNSSDHAEEGEMFNWEVKQTVPPADQMDNPQQSSNMYGFNNRYKDIVGISVSNGNDINELGDPESTPPKDRVTERLIKENIKFDVEYYASDYISEKFGLPNESGGRDIKDLIGWVSPVKKTVLKWSKSQQATSPENRVQIMPVEFTKEEQEKMINLPRRTYIVDQNHKSELLVLLLSLLFSYHFELRENEGDHTVESAWTIGKLTPQFAFLDSQIISSHVNSYNLLKASIITSIRRALSYPLHRNYNLILAAWDDVYYNLRGGKRFVLKSLLDLKELFRFHDVYYVYDKIWLDDLATWMISDQVTENTIRKLAHDLKSELTNLRRAEVTFEKLDDSVPREEDDDADEEAIKDYILNTEDELIALNLEEIETMADDSYAQSQS